MRQRRTAMWGGLAIVAAGTLFAATQPTGAAPVLRPDFTATICNAHPPHLAHVYAREIEFATPGAVTAVADIPSTSEDHAELLFKMGLLEGHLMVGRELIDAKQSQLALPHFGHPIRELYDDISGELQRRGVTGFDGELIALEALAAGKPTDTATSAQYDKVIRIIAAVRATVPAGLLDNERFMLGVLGEIATISSESHAPRRCNAGRPRRDLQCALQHTNTRERNARCSRPVRRNDRAEHCCRAFTHPRTHGPNLPHRAV